MVGLDLPLSWALDRVVGLELLLSSWLLVVVVVVVVVIVQV